MMKKISKIFPLLIVALGFMCTATSCPDDITQWELYSIKNNSSDTIYVWDFIDKADYDVFKNRIPIYDYHNYHTIAPGERKDSLYMGIPSDDLNKNFRYKPTKEYREDGVHHILILKKATFDKYSTEQLHENQIYDAKYTLTKSEIMNMGYVVNYP